METMRGGGSARLGAHTMHVIKTKPSTCHYSKVVQFVFSVHTIFSHGLLTIVRIYL